MPSTDDAPEMVPATPVTDVVHAAARVEGAAEAAAVIEEVEAKLAEAEAAAEDEDAKPPKDRVYPEEHTHYTITLWAGIQNFRCNDCAWARASRDERRGVSQVMAHWVDTHSEDANVEMVPSGVVDAQGQPIMRRRQRR